MMHNTKTILVVEDQTISAHLIFNIVEKDYRILFARTLADADNLLFRFKVDLILLDNKLPDGLGLEYCVELKKNENTQSIPVIMVTADTDENIKCAAFAAGAVEFMKKPPRRDEALETIKKYI
jgi:DNA-binding response OmpR family regulator